MLTIFASDRVCWRWRAGSAWHRWGRRFVRCLQGRRLRVCGRRRGLRWRRRELRPRQRRRIRRCWWPLSRWRTLAWRGIGWRTMPIASGRVDATGRMWMRRRDGRRRRWIGWSLTRKTGEKLAMVLDIDETSLSNYCELKREDYGFLSAMFNEWAVSPEADYGVARDAAVVQQGAGGGGGRVFYYGAARMSRERLRRGIWRRRDTRGGRG